MARLEPLPRAELAQYEKTFQLMEDLMGFVPNSMMTMGRWPELLAGFSHLAGAIAQGNIDPQLRTLIGFVSSNASTCRYCQAHLAQTAKKDGVPVEKLQAAFEFETSPLFTDAERAALRVAYYGSLVPNAVEDQHFDDLKNYYTDAEIVEIVGIISTFGYLNRWNDTMATTLEELPRTTAESDLVSKGWEVSKHT